ncbi:MAG: hypothetical protein H7287_06365 [Thermoleophilia bacterium]|nr:hypothetical protein [Thermoleophilia bacterium]
MPSRTTCSARSLVGWISLTAVAAVAIAGILAFVGSGSTDHATVPLTLRAAGDLQRAQAENQRRDEVRQRDAAFQARYATLRAQATRSAQAHEPRRPHAPRAVRITL